MAMNRPLAILGLTSALATGTPGCAPSEHTLSPISPETQGASFPEEVLETVIPREATDYSERATEILDRATNDLALCGDNYGDIKIEATYRADGKSVMNNVYHKDRTGQKDPNDIEGVPEVSTWTISCGEEGPSLWTVVNAISDEEGEPIGGSSLLYYGVYNQHPVS